MINAFDLAAGRAWALSEDELLTIMTVAARAGEGPEAVALRLGRPLENTRTATVANGIATVPLDGPMFRRANLFTEISGATSTEQFAQDFQAALDNPAVTAIVLDISSPGGEAAGVNEVAKAIYQARGTKPITAYVGERAASGAYWIASAADRIVIDETALLGSIGAVSRYVKNPERPGVQVTEIVSSQSPKKRLDPESPEGRADVQRQVDALAQVFVESVARNRGVDAADVLGKFGQGGVEIGAVAVGLGMADAVGSLSSVLTDLARQTARAPGSIFRGASMEPKTTTIEPMNAVALAALYPEAAEALRAEGRAAARTDQTQALADARAAGATAERARIADIHAAALPGYEALRDQAIDTGMAAPDFALALVKAQKAKGTDHLAALREDETRLANLKPAAVPAVETGKPAAAVDPNLPLDERCKAEWDKDAKLQAEFGGNFAAYLAYAKAEAAGKVRRLTSKAG